MGSFIFGVAALTNMLRILISIYIEVASKDDVNGNDMVVIKIILIGESGITDFFFVLKKIPYIFI